MSNDLPKQVKDIHRQRFGRLIALSFEGTRKTSGGAEAMWRCACDCGAFVIVIGSSLRTGNTRSCGCLAIEQQFDRNHRHGHAARNKKDPEYTAWMNMKQRCYNSNKEQYRYYGGKGVLVCDRWLRGEGRLTGFQCFRMDMGERPSPKHSLDRIDRSRHYEPGNCRWATQSEQIRNSDNATILEYRGDRMPMIELAERYGLDYYVLRNRVKYGWTVADAVETPTHRDRLLTIDGRPMTIPEAALISPVSAAGIRKRLKQGWNDERAVLEPRQRTGPKPRRHRSSQTESLRQDDLA